MANQKVKAKSGMQGKGSVASRWMKRHEAKKAAKKQRRKDDKDSKSNL